MTNIITNIPCKKIGLSAVIIRADGTREELGTIAYYHKNPLMRLGWRILQLFKRK